MTKTVVPMNWNPVTLTGKVTMLMVKVTVIMMAMEGR